MQGTFDKEDIGLATIFALSAASTVGIADVTAFGWALTDVVYTTSGVELTLGTILAAAAFAGAYVTNDVALDRLQDEYRYAALGTAAMIVAIPLVPELHNMVTSNDYLAVGAVAVQSAGYAAVSYLA